MGRTIKTTTTVTTNVEVEEPDPPSIGLGGLNPITALLGIFLFVMLYGKMFPSAPAYQPQPVQINNYNNYTPPK